MYRKKAPKGSKGTTKPSFNNNNQYLPFTVTDGLFRPNLSRLKDPDFKEAITKMTRDANLLLYMNQQQFWQEVTTNKSVGFALESYLTCMSRRYLDRYDNLSNLSVPEFDQKDYTFATYCQFVQIVLMVYYRISQTPTQDAKMAIYDYFLLDIPKMLDLASIYGESNPEIVKKIIGNAFRVNRNYDGDVDDFYNTIEKHPALASKQDRYATIDFSPRSMSRKNFGNREKFMMEETAVQIFKVKDMLINLDNFMTYFPRKYACELASDYKIQERCLRGLAMFLKESSEDWKMGEYQKFFQLHLENIRQQIAIYLTKVFKILRSILEGKQQECTEESMEVAQTTYETMCLCFTEKEAEAEFIYYRRMINHLFEQTEQLVFFLPARKINKADKRTANSIQKCLDYQNKYRKHLKIAGAAMHSEQTYDNFKKTLRKYKQMTAKKDSQKVKAKQSEQEQERRKREPLTSDQYWNIQKLKYGSLGKEYDDQPEEEEQFRRVERQVKGPANRDRNTNIKFVMSRQQRKQLDPDLSVFSIDKSSISNHNLSFTLNSSSISNRSQVSNFSKAKKKYVEKSFQEYEKQERILNENVQSESFLISNDKDLSVFRIEGENQEPVDLSFSLSNVDRNEEKSIQKSNDEKDLEDLLSDITKQVKEEASQLPFEMNGEFDIEGEEAFTWQNEEDGLDTSFPDINL